MKVKISYFASTNSDKLVEYTSFTQNGQSQVLGILGLSKFNGKHRSNIFKGTKVCNMHPVLVYIEFQDMKEQDCILNIQLRSGHLCFDFQFIRQSDTSMVILSSCHPYPGLLNPSQVAFAHCLQQWFSTGGPCSPGGQ